MLRAIAATMVVFVHFDTELTRLHHQPLGSFWLATGVDIFFVISGFIMWTSVERRSWLTAREFLRNRIIRIVPLYWLMTSFVVAVALLAPQATRTTQLQPVHVTASYLFLPARHPVTHAFWPVVVPGWSLNYEMLFYVVFAIALQFSGGRRLQRVLLITAMLMSVLLIGRLTETQVDVMHFYASPVTIEFLMGIALAIFCNAGLVRRSYSYFALIPVGFSLLWAASHLAIWPYTTFVGALLIVTGAVLMPPVRPNILSHLGDASYSLYLTHGVVLAALAWLCERLLLRVSPLAFIAVGLTCAFAVAFLVFEYVERPVTASLKHRSNVQSRPVPKQPAFASKSLPGK